MKIFRRNRRMALPWSCTAIWRLCTFWDFWRPSSVWLLSSWKHRVRNRSVQIIGFFFFLELGCFQVLASSTIHPWNSLWKSGGSWLECWFSSRESVISTLEGSSVSQSINQSINQLLKQSINQLLKQSINRTITQAINQSINQSTKGLTYFSIQFFSSCLSALVWDFASIFLYFTETSSNLKLAETFFWQESACLCSPWGPLSGRWWSPRCVRIFSIKYVFSVLRPRYFRNHTLIKFFMHLLLSYTTKSAR